MNLLKTSFLTAISTFVKIVSGFVLNKVIAIYAGPAGIAIIAQFQNFITISTTFASGAINNGITKYIAEHHDDHIKRTHILSTAILISFICSVIVSALIIIFYKPLTIYFLKNEVYNSIFLIFGITLVFFSLNYYILSVLNGYKEIKKFVLINITSSIVSLILVSLLVIYFGLFGALLSFGITQAVVFFIALFFVLNSDWFKISNFLQGFKKESLINLGKYSLMALTTALTVPVAQILIRNYIAGNISLEAAGFWQGVWKISDVYLLLITTSLSIYYLPRLSEIKNSYELRKEIISTCKIALPVVAALATSIYIFKSLIIKILFTDKFLAMSDLFAFQLIGDFFKISCWLLGFVMIAKAMTKKYVVLEIISSASLVTLTIVFINKFGLKGTTQAFALNNFLCLLVLVWQFKDLLFCRSNVYGQD